MEGRGSVLVFGPIMFFQDGLSLLAHAIKTYGLVEVYLHHCSPWHWMVVSDLFSAPVAFTLGE